MENAKDKERKMKTRENQQDVSFPSKIPSENNFIPPGYDNCKAKDECIQEDAKESKSDMLYSPQSQLKRRINSEPGDGDTDNISQSGEPLTKKPNKSRTTTSIKLTSEIQRREQMRDKSFVSEVALNVDLIVESLFRFMGCTTLKSCRLVCKKWKYFGAKELQRRRNVVSPQLSFGYVIDKSKKSVQSLLTVMQNSETNSFPCASFNVVTEELSSPRIKNFFRVAEARNQIKKLSLVLSYEKKKLLLTESTLLVDLRDLLLHQVPNLEALEINFCLPLHWADRLNTWNSGLFHLENSPCLLPKLTGLDMSGALIPRKWFEGLMDAAVNLQSYRGSDFSPELLEYFVDGNGRYRIHLLQHLHFRISGAFVEVMERLVIQHGDNLKLKTFFFCHFWRRLNHGAIIWPRASFIISRILNSSASTLRTLVIGLMRFLPGLLVPRLPNVNVIYLGENFDEDDIDNNYFFPSGFNFAHSFPNLISIGIAWGSILKSIEILSITEPVTSVKHIFATEQRAISDEIRDHVLISFPCVQIIEGGMQI